MSPLTTCRYRVPHQAGLSLVELMIGLTIGLFLLLGISTLIMQQNSTRTEMEKSSRQIENGRYAIQLLNDDIQMAGFYGEFSPASGVAITTPDPCDITDNTANLGTTGNLGWNNNAASLLAPVPIFGYDGAATDPTPSGCLDNYKANTAVLVIRRTSANAIPAASAVAGTTYLQVSKCSEQFSITPFVLGTSGFNMREKDCANTPPGTLAELRPYIVRIYYVSTCSFCGTDTIPTLKMVEFADGEPSVVPLVEGIENIQFEYGIDTQGGRVFDANTSTCVAGAGGDGAPDSFTPTPTAAQWPDVTAVKVYLLARNNEPTPGYVDSKTYNLGAAASAVTVGGPYKRHAYNQLVRAVNPSGRRETCLP